MVLPSTTQSGRSTMRSRGIETPYADFRSAATCSRIVVSETPPPASPSTSQPAQSRVSVPITRMLSGSCGSSAAFGAFGVGWWIAGPASMLPSRWL